MVLLSLLGCTTAEPARGGNPAMVTLGVGSSTEQTVLAALTLVALQSADIPVEVVPELGGTRGLRRAARTGQVDLFWDATGAAWALGLGQQDPPADPGESYERVAREDARRNDFVWLDPTSVNATLALFVRGEDVGGQDATLTWIAGLLSQGERLCADPDFIERPGGLEQLVSVYPINIEQLVDVPAAEARAIDLVAEGRCFAGVATATSGAAVREGLVPVRDDLTVFPAFVIAPVVRAVTLERFADLEEALRPVIQLLDTARLAELNARVEGGQPPEEVAEAALGDLDDPSTTG